MTVSENRKYELFKRNDAHITYLSITPELGVWEWIEQHPDKLKECFDQYCGIQSFDVSETVRETSRA